MERMSDSAPLYALIIVLSIIAFIAAAAAWLFF